MASPLLFDPDRTNQTHTLSGGRVLGFAEYGPKDGYPIFDLHGLPGSRLEGKLFEIPAREHNARIITIERPGVGLSSPQPGRTILDHAKDVQALAAHLGLEAYSIMGVSGGGPYALACAYEIPPEQLRSVAVVAGCGVYDPETCKSMMKANQWMFWALKAAPWGADLYVRCLFGPMLWFSDEQLEKKTKQQNESGGSWIAPPPDPKDTEAMADGVLSSILIKEVREHFRQGFGVYTEDGTILAGELGFDLADVQQETVRLWYGKRDVSVPAAIGQDYATRLGSKAKLRIEDETHLSLVKNLGSEIIKNLIQSG
jgi:pimeloyl-ACP methyl ester carboxylesterase